MQRFMKNRWLLAIASIWLAAHPARADLVAHFQNKTQADVRIDRLPALIVAAGQSPTPFLDAGPFQVAWRGKFVLPKRLRLMFSSEGGGMLELKINDEVVLTQSGVFDGKPTKPLRLNPGEHKIEISYSSRDDGSAELRLLWEEAGMVRQVIPAKSFIVSDPSEATPHEQSRRGRQLFAQHQCGKCHTASDAFGKSPMPELFEFAPILQGLGERVRAEWLHQWLLDPHGLRPDTQMPALLPEDCPTRVQDASDLVAHFLQAVKNEETPPAVADAKLIQNGGLVFHELGCVACHQRPEETQHDGQRIPLHQTAAKFLPQALIAYLEQPERHHPFTQMPNFNLTAEESQSLAAYLLSASAEPTIKPIPPGDAARGAVLAQSLQCGVCHPGSPMSPTDLPAKMEAIFQKDWSAGGCVAPPAQRGKSPVLNLTDDDRAALVKFSQAGKASLGRDQPAEYVRRQVQELRCIGCHDDSGMAAGLDRWHSESDDLTAHDGNLKKRVLQTRPALDFTGEMLYTSAIESIIAGKNQVRPRPWLGMRMPVFRYAAPLLAEGFSNNHGLAKNRPEAFTLDQEKVSIGDALANSKGFGCNTCHAVGELPPTAAFEVQGVNFNLTKERIREPFYHRWMDDPQNVRPGTKMPRYAVGNQSQRTDVLSGDARAQYDAIWHYLNSIARE